MKLTSPLQLKHFDIVDFHFKINENRDNLPDKDNPENFNFNIDIKPEKHTADPYKRRLMLKFKLSKATDVCLLDTLSFKVYGYFEIEKGMEAKEINNFLLFNGLGILYSMMRTHVIQLSALSSCPGIYLPTIDINVIVQKFLDSKKRGIEKSESKISLDTLSQ